MAFSFGGAGGSSVCANNMFSNREFEPLIINICLDCLRMVLSADPKLQFFTVKCICI